MSELVIKWRFKIPAVSAHMTQRKGTSHRAIISHHFRALWILFTAPWQVEYSNKLKITQMGMKWTMVRYSARFINQTASVPKLWLTADIHGVTASHFGWKIRKDHSYLLFISPKALLNLPSGLRGIDYEHFMTLLKT